MDEVKLTFDEMLARRAAGESSRAIAVAAGTSHTAVLKKFRRADKAAAGPQTSDSLKKRIIEGLDPAAMSTSQKLGALRSLSKSRKRIGRGDLDAECVRYVERVAGRTFTAGCPPITREAAERFFRSVMTGTWTPPDLSQIRAVDPVYPRCQNCEEVN
jgi:hypothetical protein